MKPEQSEVFYIEDLFAQSREKGICRDEKLHTVDRLTGDASTRRYYRLFTDKNSYVVCLDNPQTDHDVPHPFASKQAFFEQAGIRVPRILDMNLARGYLLEEDLGDVTFLSFLSGIKNEEEEFRLYERVLQQLLVIHRLARKQVDESQLFKLSFDKKKYMDEMEFTFKYFLGFFLKSEDLKSIDIIRSEAEKICDRLSAQPMVLTHRDFHSRNIMVKADGELVFIDFQDARLGIPQYDLVSLLEDCYYEVSSTNSMKLKRLYYEELPASMHGQRNWAEFQSHYSDMLFQRVFKAIGSFSYIYATRQDDRYLKYIGFGMEKIRKMLMQDERYTRLRQVLFNVYYGS